jgi:hypothetical protein
MGIGQPAIAEGSRKLYSEMGTQREISEVAPYPEGLAGSMGVTDKAMEVPRRSVGKEISIDPPPPGFGAKLAAVTN